MVRFRINYEKVGVIRFASHRDLLRMFTRGLTAGGVPVCYSQGFNPHPRLSFGPSLRTGWEGLDEYLDVLLEHPLSDLELRCNERLPEGLRMLASSPVAPSVPKLSADITAARYEVAVDESNLDEGQNPQWDHFVRTTAAIDRSGGASPFVALEDDSRDRHGRGRVDDGDEREDGEPLLLEISVRRRNGTVRIEYLTTMRQGKGLFPEFLERYFGDSQSLKIPFRVARSALYVERDGAYHSPISKGVVQNSI